MAEIDWKDARKRIAEDLVYSDLNWARAYLALDALVREMAEEMRTELGFMDSMWDRALIDRWEALLARAKETRDG